MKWNRRLARAARLSQAQSKSTATCLLPEYRSDEEKTRQLLASQLEVMSGPSDRGNVALFVLCLCVGVLLVAASYAGQ